MPKSIDFQAAVCVDLAAVITIANSTTVSAAVDLAGTTLHGLILPAALTGVAMTFQMSDTLAGTYVAVQNLSGASHSVTVAASKFVPVDPNIFAGIRFLKLVSGSAEAADRTIILSTRAAI